MITRKVTHHSTQPRRLSASGVDPVLRLGMHAPGGEVGADFHSIATGYRPPAGMG